MKRKIFFITTCAIQIIMAIYSLFNLDAIISSMAGQFENLPEALTERTNSLMQNSGGAYVIFMLSIAIIVNLYIIYLALNNKLLKKKGSVVACSVVAFFTAVSSWIELLAIINIIAVCSLKRVNPEDFPDKKKEMPKLKKEKVNREKVIYAVILLAVYFSQFLWKHAIPDNPTSKLMASALFYILMIVLSISFFKDLLKENFKVFRENFKAYFQNLIRYVGLFYLAYFGISLLSIFLSRSGVSVNQESVESLPIWFSFPLAVIYAPIVEESLFRGCIRRFIKNDKVFIVVSALAFGLLHTAFTEATLYNVIVVALPYMAIGGFLAYLYVKTNNICTNMAFHSFHNTIAMIITILIKGI